MEKFNECITSLGYLRVSECNILNWNSNSTLGYLRKIKVDPRLKDGMIVAIVGAQSSGSR